MQLRKEADYYISMTSECRGSSSLMFDIGAHVGHISQSFLDSGFRVVAVEPDEECQYILKNRFNKKSNFQLVSMPLSSTAGIKTFYKNKRDSALNTLNPVWKSIVQTGRFGDGYDYEQSTRQTSTIDELIVEYGIPQIVKIDVEGYELEVLKGLSYDIPMIFFEANLPEFINQTMECMDYLLTLNPRYKFNFSVDFGLYMDSFCEKDEVISMLRECNASCIEMIAVLKESNIDTFQSG